ncbi:uncharacterized protein LOC130997977 [Salvia miltiorrhiza]|uniref:uncharacterized protein LOC130997977 n=1 Tax=Salvia miltiorrhiza TaxID=226208 RepID=UPI0025AC1598|nr:uncharacterized protein LOC130997977 [Salvia miltiorrhiza]
MIHLSCATVELGVAELDIIWSAPTPPKVITTAWRALKGKMPTCDNLLKRNIAIPPLESLCVLCKMEVETTDHIFFKCESSSAIWTDVAFWLGKNTALHCKVRDHFNAFINLGDKKETRALLGVWAGVIWVLWKTRNECKFQQGEWNKNRVVADLKSRVWSWMNVYNISKSPCEFRRWFLAANFNT